MKRLGAVTVVLGMLLGCSSDSVSTQDHTSGADIEVNSTDTFQTISGWEATSEIGQSDFPQDLAGWEDAVLDSAAALGINRLRLEVPAGTEIDVDYFTPYVTGTGPRSDWRSHWLDPVNDNSDPYVIDPAGFQFAQVDFAVDHVVNPLRQRLAARGEDVYVNLEFVGAVASAAFRHEDQPQEYAEVILATFQHLETKYGWVPDALEMVLEPDAGAQWTGAQIGQVLVAAAQRLSDAGYTPDFIGPSTANMSAAPILFDDMVAQPGAAQLVSEFSYHRYGGVSVGTLESIASRASQRGIRTSMLEHIGSGYEDLLEDLIVGNNSAWQQYVLGFPTGDNGAQYLLVDPTTNTVTLGSRTKFLGQVFRYVRAQAVRIRATSTNPSLTPVAFINADGSFVVVVDAAQGGQISVGQLPAGTYGVTYTSTSAYDEAQADVTIATGEVLETSIPVPGLVTIFQR